MTKNILKNVVNTVGSVSAKANKAVSDTKLKLQKFKQSTLLQAPSDTGQGVIPSTQVLPKTGLPTNFFGRILQRFADFAQGALSKIAIIIFRILSLGGKLENGYIKALMVLYIPRIFFFIILLIIVIWTLVTGIENGPSKNILQIFYSIINLIIVICIFIGSIFVASKLSGIIKNDPANPPSLLLLLVASWIMMMPYVFDLIAAIFISGILRGYYTASCNGANPNPWQINTGLVSSFSGLLIGLVFFSVVINKLRAPKLKAFLNPFINLFVCATLSYLVYYYLFDAMEKKIGETISYWIKKSDPDKKSSSTDCMDSDKDSPVNHVFHMIMAIIFTILFILIIVMQMVPLFGLPMINMRIRTALGTVIDTGVRAIFKGPSA